MRRDTRKRYSKEPLKEVLRYAAYLILAALAIIVPISAVVPTSDKAMEVAEATTVPYYMTEEYKQAKAKEEAEAEAKAEAEALRASIEAYQEEQEKEAEEAFKAMQEEEELPFPFNTMSQDYGAGDLDGFSYYEIPKEYKREGGYFPEAMQMYLFSLCAQYAFDYPTAIAIIETESAYQYDLVGDASDSGYFQVVPKWHVERMKKLGATDMLNPYQNTSVAMDYLTELLEKYDGSYAKTLTAYNCGPTGAYKYYFSAGVDANGYAKKVLNRAERIRKELAE